MIRTSVYATTFVCLSLALVTGCSGDADDGGVEALGAHEGAITSSNRLTMNHLAASSLGVIQLSGAALSNNGLTVAQSYLLETKGRREVLTYLVKCALPVGGKLAGSFKGKSYTFAGHIGVAPEWMGAPLSESGRHWVSACVLAHINGYDEEVHISLRGAHPSLAASPAEKATYMVEEMSFYGDLFKVNATSLYACAGKGPQGACNPGMNEYKAQRSCDEDEACVLHVPGPCHDVTLSGGDACEGGGLGLSSGCHAGLKPKGQAWPAADPAYLEVVTVYMTPGDFEDYYDCDTIDILGIEL